jgi:hypothetical protein
MGAKNILGLITAVTILLVLSVPLPGHAAESPPTILWNVTSFPQNFWPSHGPAVGADGHPVTAASVFAPDVPSFVSVVKHDGTTGAVIWRVDYGLAVPVQGLGVAVGPDGHPVVVGVRGSLEGPSQMLIVKFDGATGAVLWSNTAGSGPDTHAAITVAIGPDDHPVGAAISCPPDNTATCRARILKFDGATGAVLWDVVFAPETNPLGVAVGADGNPVFGVVFFPPGEYPVSRTVKVDGQTGAVLWDVPFTDGGVGYGVAVGPDGHPVVAGTLCPLDCDFRTVKYDGATGAELWRVIGPASSDLDIGASAVGVGADGNPVVVGGTCTSTEDSILCDIRTVKHDGTTGAELWTAVLDVAPSDTALGVAVGPDGNPVLNSIMCYFGDPQHCDVLTTKYLLQNDTPAGASIAVALNGGTGAPGGASVTYAGVTEPGTTTLVAAATGPTPPAGYAFGDPLVYYEIATTAAFTTPVQVCLNYAGVPAPSPESGLKLLHYEGGSWADVTTSLDTDANVICGESSSLSPFVIARSAGDPLTALGPADVWVGLKNSDDVGIRFDLRVEVYRNGTELVGSGEATGVAGGSSGFNNAQRHTIALAPLPDVTFASGDALGIRVLVRNACTGSGKNSGTARLWFNDAAADSRFAATIGASATYFLRDGFALGTAAGQGPKTTIDVAAGAKCSPFKTIGTWSAALP